MKKVLKKVLNSNWITFGVVIIFIATAILTGVSIYKIVRSDAPDFGVLWSASRDLLASKNLYINKLLYTGVGYPPNTLLFYLPFTIVSYHIAQEIFIFLTVASLIISTYLSLALVSKKVSSNTFLLITAMVFLSFPTKYTLGMGQNNAISLLLILLSLYFFVNKKESVSGVFLGLSIALKTIFGFFIFYYFLKFKWRLLAISLFVIAISVLLVTAISHTQINLYEYYITEVIPPLLNFEGREIYYNQGIVGFVSRLVDDLTSRKSINGILSLILVSPVLFFNYLKKEKILLGFSAFIISLLLIDTLSWQHHFIWLIFPFVVLGSESIKSRKYGLLLLILTSYLLVGWNFKNPLLYLQFPKVLLLSNTFYGTILLLFINLYFLAKQKK